MHDNMIDLEHHCSSGDVLYVDSRSNILLMALSHFDICLVLLKWQTQKIDQGSTTVLYNDISTASLKSLLVPV